MVHTRGGSPAGATTRRYGGNRAEVRFRGRPEARFKEGIVPTGQVGPAFPLWAGFDACDATTFAYGPTCELTSCAQVDNIGLRLPISGCIL